MPVSAEWPILECRDGNVEAILAAEPVPLKRLADGKIAAIVIRQAFPSLQCRELVRLLINEGLMFDSNDPRVRDKALKNDTVGKYLGRSVNPDDSPRKRIDVGASLGNYGDNPDEFFQQADEARELFERLFAERPNPITTMYDTLQTLCPDKTVATAYEPDGRRYGPAIFRIHYGGFTYGPHFDSVRNREQRTNYAVYRFDSQFAGVLCVQNATRDGVSAQGIVHRQFWNPDIDDVLKTGRFHEYAAANAIPSVRVDLAPGDLYFFNTGLIHEVPGVAGDLPRVVLATFIGYSSDDPEVMVWS